MKDVVVRGPKIDRIERFQALQAGHYWRAKKAIAAEGIDANEVLLIQSVRWVEEKAHTVILRPHPSKIGTETTVTIRGEDGKPAKHWLRFTEHRFLLEDFLKLFEFEPDAEQIRRTEVGGVQARIAQLQSDLIETTANPARMAQVVQEGMAEAAKAALAAPERPRGRKAEASSKETSDNTALIATGPPSAELVALTQGSLSDALASGITPAVITQLKSAASREHQIATIKAKWIESKTGAIAETLRALSPYYEEQAAAALALTEDVRDYVSRLMDGIGSLDLYVGKGVQVRTIREGTPANADIPLTLVQRKLLMDEELAVWADVGERFDFTSEEAFFDALREEPALVAQIFPTERCVLVMATTRRHIDYGEAWTNVAKGEENRKVFMLVRNGENLHQVFSPVESHLGAARLFPSKNEVDGIFKGIDGRNIRFEDVAYTDHLAIHDKLELHYKRFLLLACGLDHRLRLFGEFYPGPQNFEFVSLEFQEKYCRYLFDDDGSGTAIAQAHQPLSEWIAEKNGYLRAGSRVLCNYKELMNPDTAPAACKREREGRINWRYRPTHNFEVTVARREDAELVVDTEVSGYSMRAGKERSFQCRVSLDAQAVSRWDYVDLPYLCLDAVSPAEVQWFIHHRESRREHLTYIRFFKQALAFLQQERAAEAPARSALLQALAEGRIATGDEAVRIIDQAVIAWRAANNGRALPAPATAANPAWKSLLDQLYMLAGEGSRQVQEVQAFVAGLGLIPLRLVLSGTAKFIIYAAPGAAQCDDRFEAQAWVHRLTLQKGRRGFAEKSRRWAMLPKAAASETTLHEWEAVAAWANRTSVFASYEAKQRALGCTADFAERLTSLSKPLSSAAWQVEFERWDSVRREILRDSRYVSNPSFAAPFGLMRYPRQESFSYLAVGTRVPHAVLHHLAPDDSARRELRKRFISPYANKVAAGEQFDFAVARETPWELLRIGPEFAKSSHAGYFSSKGGVYESSLSQDPAPDPRLARWFAAWLASDRRERSGALMWLADGVMSGPPEDPTSELTADALLGITLPSDFAPVELYQVRCTGDASPAESPFDRWFDLVPAKMEGYSVKAADGRGVGYSSNTHANAAAAVRAMQRIMRTNEPTLSLTAAADLTGAPQPPAGVQRWYLTPSTSAAGETAAG